ncbi:MAG: hypothetical protein Q8N81_00675, partial [bacterium]|nr:hypothetical protein [bacterium]
MDTNQQLANFIKYCLGYIKLTRARTLAAQQKASVQLPKQYFDLAGLLNGDADGDLAQLINLETFYNYDPRKVTDDIADEYQKEKKLANQIVEIYNKFRNDQYTKQTILNFGYFEIEVPLLAESAEDVETEFNEEEVEEGPRTRIDRFPLFSVPVRIENEVRVRREGTKYYVYFADLDIQVNYGVLEGVLGEDLYYQLVEEVGKFEMEGRLTLPI